MIQLGVGQINPFEIKNGLSILWDKSGFLLNIKLDNLSKKEVNIFTKGDLKIDLVLKNDLMFFIINMKGFMEDSDIAFTPRISPCTKEDIGEVYDGQGYAFTMLLTEGTTNIIKGMRLVAINNEMSRELNRLMKDEFDRPFDLCKYMYSIMNIQMHCTSKDLKDLSIAQSSYKKE